MNPTNLTPTSLETFNKPQEPISPKKQEYLNTTADQWEAAMNPEDMNFQAALDVIAGCLSARQDSETAMDHVNGNAYATEGSQQKLAAVKDHPNDKDAISDLNNIVQNMIDQEGKAETPDQVLIDRLTSAQEVLAARYDQLANNSDTGSEQTLADYGQTDLMTSVANRETMADDARLDVDAALAGGGNDESQSAADNLAKTAETPDLAKEAANPSDFNRDLAVTAGMLNVTNPNSLISNSDFYQLSENQRVGVSYLSNRAQKDPNISNESNREAWVNLMAEVMKNPNGVDVQILGRYADKIAQPNLDH